MKDNKLVEGLDDEYSKLFADIVAIRNASVSHIEGGELCRELLLKLLTIHGYKKTLRQFAKLARKINRARKGIYQ